MIQILLAIIAVLLLYIVLMLSSLNHLISSKFDSFWTFLEQIRTNTSKIK